MRCCTLDSIPLKVCHDMIPGCGHMRTAVFCARAGVGDGGWWANASSQGWETKQRCNSELAVLLLPDAKPARGGQQHTQVYRGTCQQRQLQMASRGHTPAAGDGALEQCLNSCYCWARDVAYIARLVCSWVSPNSFNG